MNIIFLIIIGIPLVEIFVMIKIGSYVGAFNTIMLIFLTAVTGIYFARLEGLHTLRSGMNAMMKNEMPFNEMVAGATIAFAAVLLILPGFITDFIGFILLIPFTRNLLIKKFIKKPNSNTDIIEGELTDTKKDKAFKG